MKKKKNISGICMHVRNFIPAIKWGKLKRKARERVECYPFWNKIKGTKCRLEAETTISKRHIGKKSLNFTGGRDTKKNTKKLHSNPSITAATIVPPSS